MTRDPRIVDPPHARIDDDDTDTTDDPLRLCIFATVALLGWLLGPVALIGFAVLGFVGYARARRRGLLRSRCVLGDTRLVLVYLAVLVGAGVFGVAQWIR